MNSISLELAIIFLLLLANGIFSMTEIAVVSVKKAPRKQHPITAFHPLQLFVQQLLLTIQLHLAATIHDMRPRFLWCSIE